MGLEMVFIVVRFSQKQRKRQVQLVAPAGGCWRLQGICTGYLPPGVAFYTS